MTARRFTPLAADEILDALYAKSESEYRPINMVTATSAFDVAKYIDLDIGSLLQGAQHYSDPHGLPELREELASYFHRRFAVTLNPQRFFITDGAMGALTMVFARFLSGGDEVIIPGAAFPGYQTLAEVFHARAISCPLNADGSYDRSALKSLINSKSRLLLSNSPSNPLGTVSTREELEHLTATGLPVVSDEVYEAFSFDTPFISTCQVSDETFVVGSFSKAFAVAGLRIGYLILPASEDPFDIWNIKASINFSTAMASQRIALHLIRHSERILALHRQYLLRNRQLLIETCQRYNLDLRFVNPAGFFALVDTSSIDLPAATIGRELVDEYRLGIMPARDFGPHGGSYIRVNFAARSDDLVESLQRIRDYMSSRVATRAVRSTQADVDDSGSWPSRVESEDGVTGWNVMIAGGGGAMGRLFQQALQQHGANVHLVDVAAGPEVHIDDIANPSDDLRRRLEQADAVLLCTPEEVVRNCVVAVARGCRPGSLLIDVCSTKHWLDEMRNAIPDSLEYLSLHPLFGPSLGFSRQNVAAISIRSGRRSDSFVKLLTQSGARVTHVSIDEHERAMAAAQVALHATVLTYGGALERMGYAISEGLPLSTPPQRTMLAMLARMAAGSFHAYRDIQLGNAYRREARESMAATFKTLSQALDEAPRFAEFLERQRTLLGGEHAELLELCKKLYNDVKDAHS